MRKMAVKNDKNLDLQIREKSDVLLFAENWIDYLLFRNCRNYDLKWKPTVFSNHSYNTSVPIIRRAIHFIEYALQDDHKYLANKMKKAKLINSKSYEILNKTLVAMYFPLCFNAKYFFPYCVNLSVMAAYFYTDGICEAPDLAKQYMHQFLQKYEVSAAEWDALCRIAENYVELLRSFPVLRDVLHRSEFIEEEDLEQQKMRYEETSSSSSEEESVSSRNARSRSRIRTESVRSKIEEYLNEYVECSSESESQIGLFRFERMTASDFKPRRVSSYDYPVVILVIGNFKMKTNKLWNKIKLIDSSASD